MRTIQDELSYVVSPTMIVSIIVCRQSAATLSWKQYIHLKSMKTPKNYPKRNSPHLSILQSTCNSTPKQPLAKWSAAVLMLSCSDKMWLFWKAVWEQQSLVWNINDPYFSKCRKLSPFCGALTPKKSHTVAPTSERDLRSPCCLCGKNVM